ncbi:MAG: glycosyl hydrolase family 31, partial [Bacteroidales bacterium]|nr:glycosyl hydrolase family 31 [Bacteroidales bacterium]
MLTATTTASAQQFYYTPLADNALRVRYSNNSNSPLPDWIYVSDNYDGKSNVKPTDIAAVEHTLRNDTAILKFSSRDNEFFYGLGQFQDGYNNVKGLPRRLTQVNTQITMPVLISNLGYGIIWNNYAETFYNLPENKIQLAKQEGVAGTETVNVTTTEGGREEVRHKNLFGAEITVTQDGDYAILLDVGQKMARRHNLQIDGKTVIVLRNIWLPPTASTIVHLTKGKHTLLSELSDNDRPVLYYGIKDNVETLTAYPSDAVDYTIIKGTPDEIIATYRRLTGTAPLMPAWALGYIHCRERFHSQKEIQEIADRFISEKIPVDVIVQDWQYWGKNGWNSMVFDADNYPDPKALTDYLHSKNIRMMLSVWSKIDKNSVVGKEMQKSNYYIPNTDWIDFFNPDAAAAYWKNFSEKLLPT